MRRALVVLLVLLCTGCYCSDAKLLSDHTVQRCASEEWSRNLREFIVERRVLWAFISVTIVSLAMQRTERCIRAAPLAEHVDKSRIEMTIVCATRVYFTPILGLGFAVELYRWFTGCSFSDAYIYSCASWAAFIDAWEWVRRWPMPSSLSLHHLGVLTMALVTTEFTPSDEAWDFKFVLLCANIGLQWTSDYLICTCFFANSIREMQWNRRVSLWSGFPRAFNVVLLVWMVWSMVQARAYLSLVLVLPLNVGYIWQTTRDWYWTYCFDSERYFLEHQQRWLAEGSHSNAVGRAEKMTK